MIKHYVGENYRQLSDDEIVERGDEFWYPREDRWKELTNPQQSIGCTVKELLARHPKVTGFRRKVETPTPVSRPAETEHTGKGSCSSYATWTPGKGTVGIGWEVLNNYAPVMYSNNWGNLRYDEVTVFASQSVDGKFWTYVYDKITGKAVVRTTFDAKVLPIGTYVKFHNDGRWYRPLTQHDNPKDYRNFWIKEVGTDEVERIAWYDKTGINGDTFLNLFNDYTFEGGSPVGAAI